MLRNFGIRSKILAALAIPVFLLLVLAGGLIVNSAERRSTATGYQEALELSTEYSDLVRALQAERALTYAVLSGETTRKTDLAQLRTSTSAAVEGLRDFELWLPALDFAQDLPQLRAAVDTGSLTAGEAFRDYTDDIDQVLGTPQALGSTLPLPAAQNAMLTLGANERAIEALAVEQNTLGTAIQAGGIRSSQERAAVQAAIVARAFTYDRAQENAALQDIELADASADLTAIENQLAGLPLDESPSASVAALQAATDAETAKLADATQDALAPARAAVQAEVDAANRAMLLTVLGALAVLALMAVLARVITRELSGPLQRLTRSASRIRDQLPLLVDRDNPDQRVELSEDLIVEVESDDEVGRLAQAFNDVNRAVVDNANQQAELRSSIAGMFVNVARRDQTLLSRQLALIDQLERTEEDPQTLSTLFKLDHLSTRMRRNAEALLVLAGIDTGRRLRRPMALSDVVRTASSEIEHYDRVDLVQTVDPQLLGHTALTASSLLAELLENATSFSDPNSRVSARTENSPKGIAVIITDEGLGMSEAEVAQANEKVASASLAEVVASKRLGLFVVGRLARRLETTVTISQGATKGITVRVDFPPSVFLPGAVTHVADPNKKPASDDSSPAASKPQRPDAGGPAASAASRMSRRPSPAKPSPSQPAPARPSVPSQGAPAGQSMPKPSAKDGDNRAARPAKPDAEVRLSQARSAEARAPKPAKPSEALPLARRETKKAPQRADKPDAADVTQPVGRPAPVAKPAVKETKQPEAKETKPAAGKETKPAAGKETKQPEAKETKPAAGKETKQPEAKETKPAAGKEATSDPGPALPKRSAATPGAARPQAAEGAVPGPRSGAQPRPTQRGGIFGGFRSRRSEDAASRPDEAATSSPDRTPTRPEDRAEGAASAGKAASPLPSRAARKSTAQTPDEDAPERPAKASGPTSHDAPRSALPERTPAETHHSPSLDILPGGGAARRSGSGRGGSLFGRLGESQSRSESTFRSPGADAPPRSSDPTSAAPTSPDSPAATGRPDPAGSSRPATGAPAAESAGSRPAQEAPVQAASSPGRHSERDRGFASEALTELSRLQAYRPSTVATGGGGGAPSALTRRQAGATPAGKLPPRPQAAGQRRNRTASDVRSMLSGFQAGVERGRSNAGQPGGGEESST